MNILFIYLNIAIHFICYSTSSDLYVRNKRTDIDLQTCIDNFDIHKDKIIRTQDSQKMGAKYLNEIDLGSREECLRLCCETDNCDVFVYEDKSSGSCYLFHCGPPEDFKCKFTHHVNYSSAVLAVNRHLPDLESQIKLTKHEQDLNKLRKTDAENEHTLLSPSKEQITTTTVKSNEVVPNTKTDTPTEKKCSRYQFECRSTKECIAIYNACDGIPQCADGSDEAVELGCPDPNYSTTVGTTPLSVPQKVLANNNGPQVPPIQPAYDRNIPTLKNQEQMLPAQDIYKTHVRPDVPSMDNPMPPLNNPNYMMPDNRIAYPEIPNIPDYNQAGSVRWNAPPSNQMYQMHPYNEKGASQIFAHKESGLQMPEGDISQYQDIGSNYQKLPYDKVYYGKTNYQQPLDSRNNWMNSQDDPRFYGRYPDNANNKNWNNNLPQGKIVEQPQPIQNMPSLTTPERSKLI